jgi:hypothetical protein
MYRRFDDDVAGSAEVPRLSQSVDSLESGSHASHKIDEDNLLLAAVTFQTW